jgi:quinoprotein dehydrogenase-associated probable ABC transporter substrate-binding protein
MKRKLSVTSHIIPAYMYSTRASFSSILLAWTALGMHAADLRVCADPNNLPYSNAHEQGFENKLARLVARDLGRTVRYVWSPQRGHFFRDTIQAGRCDLVMGVPSVIGAVQPTRPYYRSSYVFVSRRSRHLAIRSFDDQSLRTKRIGVHLIGSDDAAVPPAQALIDRGLAKNIVWYKLYPDFSRANPPAALIDAVERGDIDVAVAWGPLAGYFATRAAVPLEIVPVSPQFERSLPLAFDISMGVRHGDTKLLAELNAIIERRRSEIRRLLQTFGVPVLETQK